MKKNDITIKLEIVLEDGECIYDWIKKNMYHTDVEYTVISTYNHVVKEVG
jgi:hypothetical protein